MIGFRPSLSMIRLSLIPGDFEEMHQIKQSSTFTELW